MRKRFNPNTICSSSNYEQSKKVHKRFIARVHEENIEVISTIKVTTRNRYYVRCFGKLVEITKEEAVELKRTFDIIIL